MKDGSKLNAVASWQLVVLRNSHATWPPRSWSGLSPQCTHLDSNSISSMWRLNCTKQIKFPQAIFHKPGRSNDHDQMYVSSHYYSWWVVVNLLRAPLTRKGGQASVPRSPPEPYVARQILDQNWRTVTWDDTNVKAMNVPTAERSTGEDLQQTTTALIAGDTMSSWTRLGEGKRKKKAWVCGFVQWEPIEAVWSNIAVSWYGRFSFWICLGCWSNKKLEEDHKGWRWFDQELWGPHFKV